jgi:23S rRNA pseudouridine1911/1915/1917 synthase
MSQQVPSPEEEIDVDDEPGSTAETVVTRELAAELGGLRLDQAAAQAFPEYSRARLQQWLKDGRVLLNGKVPKGKDRVIGGEQVELRIQPELSEAVTPEELPLDIIHEDEALIIVNKPVGLVVHPAAGNRSGTLLNGLLAHCPQLASLPRGGIVHRIDKDTSGLLVIAKTLQAHQSLVAQLQEHSVTRQYEAVVCGVIVAGGTIDAPLGRHLSQRQKRAVVEPEAPDARPAVTHYRVKARYRSHTHVALQLETGRTHQIRVHMAYIGYPIVGDPTYGGRLKLPKGAVPELLDFLQQFKRQALHARVLGFEHPESGEYMEWESPLPEDFAQLLSLLEKDRA